MNRERLNGLKYWTRKMGASTMMMKRQDNRSSYFPFFLYYYKLQHQELLPFNMVWLFSFLVILTSYLDCRQVRRSINL
uniref:Uncharacterized protein n=1 Tax=Tetranychus urticae TaxID=32264 RepID=T1K1N6_TETUR